MLERIQETAAFLKGKMHTQPETAIIIGTGLGSLAGEITEKYEIDVYKRQNQNGVENNGFEPLTPCVQSRCSSQLS